MKISRETWNSLIDEVTAAEGSFWFGFTKEPVASRIYYELYLNGYPDIFDKKWKSQPNRDFVDRVRQEEKRMMIKAVIDAIV